MIEDDLPEPIYGNPKPILNEEKARECILYIISKKPGITKEELCSILYLIDFNYYEKYEEHFLGFTYIKEY